MVDKAVEMALAGDVAMLRALVCSIVPRTRDETIEFDLPKIETAKDASKASSAVLAACSRGELSLNEAREVMGLVSNHVRTIQVAEIETRLTALEARLEPEVFSSASENTEEPEVRSSALEEGQTP